MMNKPYTNWCDAYKKCHSKRSKLELYERTFKGEFGEQVKFSLFGLWEFDSNDPLMDELIDSESIRNIKFFSKLE